MEKSDAAEPDVGYEGLVPVIAATAFVAPSAIVIGDVTIGEHASIWYGCILRGDVNSIRIGARSNIQDGTIVHVTPETSPTLVGDDVLVGHGVILHGCELQNGCFIGIRATILNGAVVETGAMVAAGALVVEGTRIPAGELWGGAPARKLAPLRSDIANEMKDAVRHYVELGRRHARFNAQRSRNPDD